MTKLYVTEYVRQAKDPRGNVPAPEEPAIATQVVDFTSGAAASSAFNAKTTFVRIQADAACHVLFDTDPTADTNDPLMSANLPEYRGVPEGGNLKVSAIATS